VREGLKRAAPMGRMGKAEEVALTILFLASDESSFTIGAEFMVDGGLTAQRRVQRCALPCYAVNMRKGPSSRTADLSHSRPGGFVVGRHRFAKISAVEGVELTSHMRAALDKFDREGLSHADRRRAIVSRFAPKR
jgi:hypothetical protein